MTEEREAERVRKEREKEGSRDRGVDGGGVHRIELIRRERERGIKYRKKKRNVKSMGKQEKKDSVGMRKRVSVKMGD